MSCADTGFWIPLLATLAFVFAVGCVGFALLLIRTGFDP